MTAQPPVGPSEPMFCCSANRGPDAEELRPLTEPELEEKASQESKVAGPCGRCWASCCCLKVEERDEAAVYLVHRNESLPPSLFQRCCFCVCAPQPRLPSGIEMVPALRGLAGVSLQYGDSEMAGTLLTMKWGRFDPDARVYEAPVFDGFYGAGSSGTRAMPVQAPLCCLMNLGRCANYTYRIEFSEDYRSAAIRARGNPCVLCGCCCCPWIPAWFTVPKYCMDMTMEQADDSKDGSKWERYRAGCSGTRELQSHLLQVFDNFGQTGPHNKQLQLKAPKQVMITY